jgi:uncharacterized surface protein with fasciclin (FAS1) repeats
MVLILSPLLLALTASVVNAQDNQNSSTYVSGLINTLNNAGLNTLASAVGAVNSTSVGSQLLSKLSNTSQNYTVFAPNNDAFNNVPSSVTQDPNSLTDVVAYHIVFGRFNNVTNYPNTTIGRTALSDPNLVLLEGNKDQVVAWARRDDGQVHVLNQNGTNDPRVVQLTSYQNLQIFVIDGIILYPGDLNTTFQSNVQLSGFSAFAQSTQVPFWNTGDNTTDQGSVTQVLTGVRGLTLFAPENDAISQQISQFSGNTTALWDVLRNHILNGTTVYSPSFSNATYVSGAGENIHLITNSTGQFVTSGNTTARVVQPDVLTKNGVIHIIDRVLVNTDVDQNAANNAYSSASSAAGHSSTETGPVGVPTGGTSSNKNSNGAIGNLKGAHHYGVVALSVMFGSLFFA